MKRGESSVNAFTLTLEEVDSGSLPLVGGKGANLGELVGAGLPVPRAFCVTTAAYREMLDGSSLRARVAEILEGVDYDAPTQIERSAQAIRELIMEADVPVEVEAAIAAAYGRLEADLGENVLVSVRSSATAEDLPGMSFAGQHDTYLNVSGIEDVLEYAKRCWASLWTDRAISYRHQQGFEHEDVALAVVVQEMFASQVSGVLFTANPVTSNPKEMILNSSFGLGEAIVSGKVDPDQFSVDRQTLAVTERTIREKKTMIVTGSGGPGKAEVEVPEEQRLASSLSDAQIAELAEIALRIEEHYGFPQDIEWGLADGRFAILQSREITGADLDFSEGLELWQSPAALASLDDERWIWSRAYSDDTQTGPSTPLFYTEMQKRMTGQRVNPLLYVGVPEFLGYAPDRLWDLPWFRWYGARAYYNLTWVKEYVNLFLPPFVRDNAVLWPFPADQREEIKNMPFNWIRWIWMILKLHVTDPTISLLGTTGHLYANFESWTEYELRLWKALDPDDVTPSQVFATRDHAVSKSGFLKNVAMFPVLYLPTLSAGLRLALEHWCDDTTHEHYNRLIGGLRLKTSEQNIAVWDLAGKVKASRELRSLFEQEEDNGAILAALPESEAGRAFQSALDDFLEEYGYRGAAERDVIHYRWRHKPELVLNSVRPMLNLDEGEDPQSVDDRLHGRMLETKEQCLARARKGPLGMFRAPALKWLIEQTQDWIYYRDWERFINDRVYATPREFFTGIGRYFVRRGLMVDEEDIFFLGQEEMRLAEEGKLSARDIAIRIRARRKVYEKYSAKEPPKYVQGWRAFDDDELPDDGKGLRGVGASPGTITGRARVYRKLEDVGMIEKGDILVTVTTDPGWTTVFAVIGGVVVETGGLVSHAVMIAREYGMPCVSNLARACELIPDGQMITIDGSTGRVVIHGQLPAASEDPAGLHADGARVPARS